MDQAINPGFLTGPKITNTSPTRSQCNHNYVLEAHCWLSWISNLYRVRQFWSHTHSIHMFTKLHRISDSIKISTFTSNPLENITSHIILRLIDYCIVDCICVILHWQSCLSDINNMAFVHDSIFDDSNQISFQITLWIKCHFFSLNMLWHY